MSRLVFAGIILIVLTGTAYAADPNCEGPNMLIVQDKSGSMDDSLSGGTKYTVAKSAIQQILNGYGTKIRFGLDMFPWTSSCSVGQVRVPVGDNTSSQITTVLNSSLAQPNGSTPMADTLNALSGESSIHDASRRNFVLLITDGQDTCAYDPSNEPVQAVSSLVGSGIEGVFVVGFGSGTDPQVLSNMANAGGYPRQGSPSYYQADSAADLSNALNAILNVATKEICDGKDNDCNGKIDDGIADQSCTGLCGMKGVKKCQNGAWSSCIDGNGKPIPATGDEGKPCDTGKKGICKDGLWKCDATNKLLCVQQKQPGTEVCNGLDDDCDGTADLGPDGKALTQPCTTTCGGGVMQCLGGKFDEKTCNGPVPGNACGGCGQTPREVCNGLDDDCNGTVDDNAICDNAGEVCIAGRCIARCVNNECPGGKVCTLVGAQMMCVDSTDVACISVTCTEGMVCEGGTCVAIPCTEGAQKCVAGVHQKCEGGAWKADACPMGWECKNSVCVELSCYTQGCQDGAICTNGSCVPGDPCASMTCAADEFCRDGACVKACAFKDCGGGTTCRDGTCFSDPCASVKCDDGKVCTNGSCADDPCYWVGCGIGRTCVAGKCQDDPCRAIKCPAGATCYKSQCVKPGDVPVIVYPDGGTVVTDGGGGGTYDGGGGGTYDGGGGGADAGDGSGGGASGATGDKAADPGCSCTILGI